MSLFLQAYMQNVFHFCITVIPMMFSLSVFNVITDSMLTKSVPSSDTGELVLTLYTQGNTSKVISHYQITAKRRETHTVSNSDREK